MSTYSPEGPARPRLRPLSVGETIDVAIKICIAHWKTLLVTVLVVVVPVEVVSTIIAADSTTASFDLDSSRQSTEDLDQQLGGIAISTVLRIIAVLLVSAACFRIIAQAYLGERTDWRSSLGYAVKRTGPLLWLGLLYGLGLALGVLLLFFGTVWLYIAFAFAVPVLFVEDLRGTKALGRSFALVRGRWWRTFAVIALGFLLGSFVSGLVQGIFVVGIIADSGNDALVLTLSALAGIVGLAISTPFQAALVTVVYFDLRVRKEGFDLELLAREMAGEPVLAPAAAADGGLTVHDDGPRLPGIP
ncbi:MAG TPA: hypothetical protein VL120_09585 [Solirubrobacteraceae bacterium]|nr:hypothetical protein [Solirubrobacteraceae bacterium]